MLYEVITELLSFLAASPGRLYSRGQLMDHIYPDQRIVSYNFV